jgi:hypothetical protein
MARANLDEEALREGHVYESTGVHAGLHEYAMGNYALERTFQKQSMDEEDGGRGEEACIISIGRMASSGYKTQEGMCDDHALWAVSDRYLD